MNRYTISMMFALLSGILVGCGDSEVSVGEPLSCVSHMDCPGTSFCQSGQCVSIAQDGCKTNFECADGLVCLADGQCGVPQECASDGDCCESGLPDCGQSCIGGACTGGECLPGTQDDCYLDCHKGKVVCENGIWSACDAIPKTDLETCGDGVDNDCNGLVDEGCPDCSPGDEKECSSECGTGIQTCLESLAWGPCDAPTDCVPCSVGEKMSEECGFCGFQESTCSVDGEWMPAGICQGEGVCEAGTTEALPCGFCGEQVRTCQDDCMWSEFEECAGEGECELGAEQTLSCGLCGAEAQICNDQCVWESTTGCIENAGCFEGEIQTQVCGMCGIKVSTCNDACEWSEYGVCENEGSCTPGEIEKEDCEFCGERTRTCRDDCQWENWSDCSGAGACMPGDSETEACGPTSTQGICSQGEHYRTCNTACQWNAWSACEGAAYAQAEICGNGIDENCDGQDLEQPDEYEPNDSCYSCYYLGEDPNITIYPTTDVESDVDYFCFDGDDGTNVPGFGESIKVDLTDQPIGMDNDIFLYKGYEDCESGTPIASSVTIGGQDESITWNEATFSDDGGVFIIKVVPYEASSCFEPYILEVDGLN